MAIFGTRGARAQSSDEAGASFTFGGSECPEPGAVEREVLRLIPPERHELLRSGVRIDIDDLGDSFRVTVSKDGTSLKKSYADRARDCDGRARFAAVFAVLTVMPPELGPDVLGPPKPAPSPPPASHAPASKSAAPRPPAPPLLPLAHVELGALFGYAPAVVNAPELTTFGAELRVTLGRGAIAGTLSVAHTLRSKFELDGVHGDVSQLPASAGLRFVSDLGSWHVASDFGFLAVLQRARATGLAVSNSRTALALGLRGGLLFQYPVGSHFAPFFGPFVWFFPGPRALSALPQGVLGNLPYLWVGGTAGVSLGL